MKMGVTVNRETTEIRNICANREQHLTAGEDREPSSDMKESPGLGTPRVSRPWLSDRRTVRQRGFYRSISVTVRVIPDRPTLGPEVIVSLHVGPNPDQH